MDERTGEMSSDGARMAQIMKEIFAPGGTAEQSLKKIRDEYKKRRPIPDYTIIVPEHLELDALLINTDEYDLGGRGINMFSQAVTSLTWIGTVG